MRDAPRSPFVILLCYVTNVPLSIFERLVVVISLLIKCHQLIREKIQNNLLAVLLLPPFKYSFCRNLDVFVPETAVINSSL